MEEIKYERTYALAPDIILGFLYGKHIDEYKGKKVIIYQQDLLEAMHAVWHNDWNEKVVDRLITLIENTLLMPSKVEGISQNTRDELRKFVGIIK